MEEKASPLFPGIFPLKDQHANKSRNEKLYLIGDLEDRGREIGKSHVKQSVLEKVQRCRQCDFDSLPSLEVMLLKCLPKVSVCVNGFHYRSKN